uniref:Ig-like domain-containing protein n=1 Tax=Strigamia maritima TaxID=126957 RepID=T1JK53_STRMM
MFRAINMNLIIYIYTFLLHNQVITAYFNTTLTVIEEGTVILPCKIPPKLDKNLPLHNCIWTRSRTNPEYTGSTLLNDRENSKYISAGNIDVGDCSLNITTVYLEEDEGNWVCALVVDNKSTVLSTISITVLVTPLDPNLFFNDTDVLIGLNATTDIDPHLDFPLNLTCVSQMAYPPTTLMWKLNGEEIAPKSEEIFPAIRPSTFVTTSKVQIMNVPSIVPIQVSCIALHPSYSPGSKTFYANFTVISQATSARIQSGCDLQNSEENEIFIIEENQILPLLCNAQGIPLPSIQWEMKDEYNEWKPVFKNTIQFAIFVRIPGIYRCLASNKLIEESVISPSVLVEMESSKTVNSIDDDMAQLDYRSITRKSFLIEPRDTTVVVYTPFKLNCILNGPVYNCTWTRNGQIWSAKNDGRVEILNDFDSGECAINFKSALQGLDEGNWICYVEFASKEITKSRQAKVVIILQLLWI